MVRPLNVLLYYGFQVSHFSLEPGRQAPLFRFSQYIGIGSNVAA